jgi:16S rRNA (guanine(527)-N(7))-methyltransferase RsmG
MTFRQLLATEYAAYGTLSDDQLTKLEQHYSLLTLWNKRLNLTRIEDFGEMVSFHYCESLFLARALPEHPSRIIDVGSGAGFPGIPVAILRPDCSVDLVESHQRKAVFLREASRNIPNVRVLPVRAESCEPTYDWMIARAVRPSDVVSLKLASNVALLVGASDAVNLGGSILIVPWGTNRVVSMFHVERDKI